MEPIAACGLDCKQCPIFRARSEEELAERIAQRLSADFVHISAKDIGCCGCKGDPEEHWSPQCPILNCCVVDRALDFCFQCQEFPCDRLLIWKEKNERYQEAFSRLKSMGEQAD